MRNRTKNVSLNQYGFSKAFVDGLLALMLLFFSAELFAFTFTSSGAATTAPNCTGTYGGTYTCTNGLDNTLTPITINNSSGPVTIYITGNMAVNENISVSSETHPVTFYVDGNLSVGGYGVAANLSDSATNVTFYVRDNVTITSSTIKASIFTTGNGNIAVGNTGAHPYLVGNVSTYNGTISVYGRVVGSVKSNRGNAGDILLGNNTAMVDRVNCASNGSTSCVTNNSGGAMPSYNNLGTLIANYHLDELTWNGTANETKDTARITTGPFDGQSIGTPKPTALISIPPRSGATGTCGYAYFQTANNGSAFTLDSLPVNTSAGAKTTVSFWMFWGGGDTMPIGWNKQSLWFYNGHFGFNTDNWDVYGISSSGLQTRWVHVTAVFTNGSVTSNELYIDGVKQTLTQSGSPITSDAVVQSTLTLSGYGAFSNKRFHNSYLDEVKVYRGAVSQTQASADYNATHFCYQFLPPEDNLALTADVTTSFNSTGNPPENTKDNVTTTSSSVYKLGDGGIPVYGNWRDPSFFGQTNWVEYSWATDKILTEFKVFWWDDSFKGGETIQPTAANVEYWNGTAWVNLGSIGSTLNTFNSLLINNIVTKKIRVAMSSSKATGIVEARIYGRESAPIVYYTFDELSWSGNSGEVIDNSGNGYNATAKMKSGSTLPNTANASRAIAGTTGTCGYGEFSGTQYIDLPNDLPTKFPNLTNNMTIAAWIRTTDRTAVQRIFADDQTNNGGYALSLSDGGTPTGSLKFIKRNASGIDTNVVSSAVIQNNIWYFVAVSVNSSTSQATIYVYNQTGTQLNKNADSISYLTATDSGAASIGGENLASSESFGFKGNIDEVRVYSVALSQAEIESLRSVTHTCPTYVTNVNASSFNCIATQETSVNAGKLYTQLVGLPFDLKVIALKNTVPPVAETSFSAASDRTAILRFRDQTSNSLINFSGGETANSKNVVFTTTNTTGIVPVTGITIPQAYRNLRCEISEASVTTPSTSVDNFSVRPLSLTLSSNVTNPSIAGNNFTLTATGSTGYNGAPKLLVSNIATVQPGMLTLTDAGNTVVTDASNNAFSAVINTTTATLALRYHDVGTLNFNAGAVLDDAFTAIDNPNDCIAGSESNTASSGKFGCNIASTALNGVGRFKPDHFKATTNVLSAACSAGGFTYMSQQNLTLNTVIEAQSAQNIVSKSYNTGTLSYSVRNNTTAITASRLQKSGITWVPTSSWNNGALTLSETTLSYAKSTSADGPYENFNINYSIADSNSDNILFSGSSATNETKMRFGRLHIQNSYGSELLPLAVPIEAQYWNGASYIRNQQDNCTTIDKANISMGNYKNNLAACETQLSVASSANTTTMVGGKITAKLTKPGAGKNGSVDLTVNTNLASGTTCIPTSATATSASYPWFGATNPTARATFGLYKSPVIYMRENF